MLRKYFYLFVIVVAAVSCKKPNFDSANQPPIKSTIHVVNPMELFNRVNSVTAKVNVNAFVKITAVNANSQAAQTYFTKNQTYTADTFGTPAVLQITDVNLPAQGPYLIEVTLESNNCTIFPSLPSSCSVNIGARPKYWVQKSLSVGTLTPPGTVVTMPNPSIQSNICCN
jgi:hypothetical protein